MKMSYTALMTAATVATVLVSATPAFAQVAAGAPTSSVATATTTMSAARQARIAARQQQMGMNQSKMLTNNINRVVNNLTVRDTNLQKRVANQTAKGLPVSTEAQAAITDLETQITTLKGLLPVPTDLAAIKTVRQQFQAAWKAGVKDANTANRTLLKNAWTNRKMGAKMMTKTSK